MKQTRDGEDCPERGMRDSPCESGSAGFPKVQGEREKEVLPLPWASHESRRATEREAPDRHVFSAAALPVRAGKVAVQTDR